VLLEHDLAPGSEEGAETLDLARIGADASPHWSRVWPTPEDNPRHGGLELWMASYGYQILSRPASWSGRCEPLKPRSSRPPFAGPPPVSPPRDAKLAVMADTDGRPVMNRTTGARPQSRPGVRGVYGLPRAVP
jgi:hypothetical protein